VVLHLRIDALRQQQRLRSRVSGLVGERLERRCRGQVDDRPATAFLHPWQVARHQIDDRLGQNAQLRELCLPDGLREWPVDAVAGAVDEDLDFRAAQLLGQAPEAIFTPGDQRHAVPHLG
jgi:hypothetical protein